jgi:hypothetical protein
VSKPGAIDSARWDEARSPVPNLDSNREPPGSRLTPIGVKISSALHIPRLDWSPSSPPGRRLWRRRGRAAGWTSLADAAVAKTSDGLPASARRRSSVVIHPNTAGRAARTSTDSGRPPRAASDHRMEVSWVPPGAPKGRWSSPAGGGPAPSRQPGLPLAFRPGSASDTRRLRSVEGAFLRMPLGGSIPPAANRPHGLMGDAKLGGQLVQGSMSGRSPNRYFLLRRQFTPPLRWYAVRCDRPLTRRGSASAMTTTPTL